jgi:hypothetical protein
MLVGSVVDDMALIDVASAGELFATRTNVEVASPVEDEVGSAEGAIVASRLVPHRNMRRDLAIHQRLEQPDRTINELDALEASGVPPTTNHVRAAVTKVLAKGKQN